MVIPTPMVQQMHGKKIIPRGIKVIPSRWHKFVGYYPVLSVFFSRVSPCINDVLNFKRRAQVMLNFMQRYGH